MILRLLIFIAFIIGIDIYAFQAYTAVFTDGPVLRLIYFGITVLSLGSLIIFFNFQLRERLKLSRQATASVAFMGFSPKLFTAIFLIPEEPFRLARFFIEWMNSSWEIALQTSIPHSRVWSLIAIILASALTLSFIYGALFNVYRYSTKRVKLNINNLAPTFEGLTIVQISDIHSGSLSDKDAVKKGVDKINAIDPDIIFFTGDLVNNIADEALFLKDTLGQLKAKHGVFSILGNHDYGDYYYWETQSDKDKNLELLKTIQKEMGWKLLLNEHQIIESDGHHLVIAGVENWSASDRFPKYGRLNDAFAGAPAHATKLLLSHDPSHWKAQVLHHEVDIDAMFSGHTHGMQFGIELGNFRWSPVQYVYKQWAGLYKEAGKYLYVNRGFGVIGYPGRVGILPEITIFQLSK